MFGALDIHALVKVRTRRAESNDCLWLSPEARNAKQRCRRLELRFRHTKTAADSQGLVQPS
jgi:hypothetical protein